MNGLGVGKEIRITRRELAVVQLTEAISLFMAEKYLAAITLGGAAEEILGKLVEQHGGSATLNASLDLVDRIRREHPELEVMSDQTRTQIRERWNRVRNQLKHFNDGLEEITLNPIDEAWGMIGRALNNANALGISVSNKEDFENWIILTVTMPDDEQSGR